MSTEFIEQFLLGDNTTNKDGALEKYFALDSWGKSAILDTLHREYERCQQQQSVVKDLYKHYNDGKFNVCGQLPPDT